MEYTISEAAAMVGVSPSTLRYYEKEGLLLNVKRKNGIRVFDDHDISFLGLLNCLKNTGMPIKRIKEYVNLIKYGDISLNARYTIIQEQRRFVQDQIDQLQYYMQELDFKDWYYRRAIALGSEKLVDLDAYEKETGHTAPKKVL